MEYRSCINEIFLDDGPYSEKICPKSKKYRDYCRIQSLKNEKLRSMLSEEQLIAFDEFVEATFKVTNMDIDETFKVGVSFGIKITAEAFILNI